jgi:hypothetical protein
VNAERRSCQIYSVRHRNVFRWKWRYADDRGLLIDCAEQYELFLECVRAARAQGYEPRPHWTQPCAPSGPGLAGNLKIGRAERER